MVTSTESRCCSWLLASQCFTLTATSFDCNALIYATDIVEIKNGSSLMYSKFLPHNGERIMLMPGPNKISFLRKRASSPSTSPCLYASLGFQVAASAVPGGKQVAESFVHPA